MLYSGGTQSTFPMAAQGMSQCSDVALVLGDDKAAPFAVVGRAMACVSANRPF